MPHILDFHVELLLFDLGLIRFLAQTDQITADNDECTMLTDNMYILLECIARALITLQIHDDDDAALELKLKVAKVRCGDLSNSTDCLSLRLECSYDSVYSLGLLAS